MDLVFAGKLAAAFVAAVIRWKSPDARDVSLLYMVATFMTWALMPEPAEVGAAWYLLCAMIDGAMLLLVQAIKRCELTRALSFVLGFCVIVNILAMLEFPTDYRFFYANYPWLIMLAAAVECACLLVCSADDEGRQVCQSQSRS